MLQLPLMWKWSNHVAICLSRPYPSVGILIFGGFLFIFLLSLAGNSSGKGSTGSWGPWLRQTELRPEIPENTVLTFSLKKEGTEGLKGQTRLPHPFALTSHIAKHIVRVLNALSSNATSSSPLKSSAAGAQGQLWYRTAAKPQVRL